MYEARSGTFMGAVVLAVGLILSTTIGGWFFVKGKRGDQTITVTGSARKRIKSDLVIWNSAISYQAPVLSEAYRSLSEAVPRVKAYFISKGIKDNQITVSSISGLCLVLGAWYFVRTSPKNKVQRTKNRYKVPRTKHKRRKKEIDNRRGSGRI